MEEATLTNDKTEEKKKKKSKPVYLFLSFSITQVVKDQVATTENTKAQLRHFVSVVIPLWCPTGGINQPKEPLFRAWQSLLVPGFCTPWPPE